MDLLFQTLKQWSAVHILTMTKNSWFSTFLRLQRFPSASVSKLGLWPRHAHQFTPRSMETPVLLNGQMPQPSHIQMHIHPHTVQTKRQSWVCVRRRERVHARSSDCYKHRYSKGLLWPQCRQRSSVNWDLFCLPQETITSLFSLSVFSLSPCSLSFGLSMASPSFIAPSLAVPHLQDDHLWPLHHAPSGRTCLVDYDVWSIREEPALRSIHEGAFSADGAGLQEPVECLPILPPTSLLVKEFL